MQPTCVRGALRIVNNTGEGARSAVRVGSVDLKALGSAGARLLARIDALYRFDFGLWELLSKAERSALNLIV